MYGLSDAIFKISAAKNVEKPKCAFWYDSTFSYHRFIFSRLIYVLRVLKLNTLVTIRSLCDKGIKILYRCQTTLQLKRVRIKISTILKQPGPWFNIKMSSYQYRKSHCGDKTVVRSSYLHNEISYTGKMTSLYWIRPQYSVAINMVKQRDYNSDEYFHEN